MGRYLPGTVWAGALKFGGPILLRIIGPRDDKSSYCEYLVNDRYYRRWYGAGMLDPCAFEPVEPWVWTLAIMKGRWDG